MIVTGKDKGKTGKVVRAFPALDRVVVEGLNTRKRHEKPKKANQKGQIIDKAMPIHVSNVMFYDSSSGKPFKVGRKVVGDKTVRINKKTGATI